MGEAVFRWIGSAVFMVWWTFQVGLTSGLEQECPDWDFTDIEDRFLDMQGEDNIGI